ncbi:hypothetical protein EDC04DRAFT_256063 [Pisolithus marmoratus]|nr:hypothetical protein EDC04DRAFT_256063 [Pisolithus marmoratus]
MEELKRSRMQREMQPRRHLMTCTYQLMFFGRLSWLNMPIVKRLVIVLSLQYGRSNDVIGGSASLTVPSTISWRRIRLQYRDLIFFKKCCLDLGAQEDCPEERNILKEAAQRDVSALSVMQEEFKDAEEVAISLGIFEESEESHGFYFGVANPSDAEESNQSPSRMPCLSNPATSDPEVPYTSDSENPFPTEGNSDIEWCNKPHDS